MKRYGLIGKKLGHSFSAAYFTEKFLREGLSEYCYTPFELDEIESLPDFLAQMPELQGFNVTIPYKQVILRYLDDLSPEAREIGAVNCVKRESRGWVGYNTDFIGFEQALAPLLDETPEEALVLGTGGASQAVQYVLTRWGIPYALVSREASRGNYTYDNLPPEVVQQAHLIVNTTPLGTWPHTEEAPRIPYAYLSAQHRLFDLVYNPPLTTFLHYGEQRGARIQNGEAMLIGQAEAAWKIWCR